MVYMENYKYNFFLNRLMNRILGNRLLINHMVPIYLHGKLLNGTVTFYFIFSPIL